MPNLYPADEKAEICEKMRQLDRQKDRAKQTDGSPVALFNLFVQVQAWLGSSHHRSQPAGDVSHEPGGRLSLLSARPAVTPATLKRAATKFADAW